MSHWSMIIVAMFGAAACAAAAPRQDPGPIPATIPVDVTQQAAVPVAEEISFTDGEITLVGTLLLPGTPGPHAVAVLLSGSGPQDRDGVSPGFIPGYSPSLFLAEHLARHGIASFRYDERGVGASTGDHGTATSGDLASDAAAAVAHLRTLPGIDAARVGVVGHSEGGMLAAHVAARDPAVAFVVSLAGPTVPGYELLTRQNERIFRAAGLDEAAVERRVAAAQHAMDLTVAGDWPALEELLWETGRAELAAMPEEQRAALGDPEAYLQAQMPTVMQRYQTWMREFLIHDPATDWARIRAPVLAIFGELDTQVDAAQNRPPLESALQRAGNPDVTTVVLPLTNHLFQQHAQTGSPMEYATLAPEFMPELLEIVAGWITERMAPPSHRAPPPDTAPAP